MITVIMPSRGRPENAKKAIRAARDNAFYDINVVVGVDEDDFCMQEYEQIAGIVLDIGKPTGGCIAVINRIVKRCDTRYIALISDDCISRTEGWDKLMIDMMPPDDLAVVSPNNAESKGRNCYHPLTSKRWVDVIGYFMCPAMIQYFADPVLQRVAEGAGRMIWADNVVLEHFHYHRHFKGNPFDDTYKKNESHARHDKAEYAKANKLIAESINKLKDAICGN